MEQEPRQDRTGFLRKYVVTSLLCLLLLLSTFLTTHSLTDLLAERRGSNLSTHLVLEDLTLGDQGQVEFVQREPSLTWGNTTSGRVLPGYRLYWATMEVVSSWYSPHSFQLVKLLLVTVSLALLVTCSLALLCQGLESWSRRVWCGHPTPLLLVEASLTLALLLLLLMLVLGRQDGLLGQGQALHLGLGMLGVGTLGWLVGGHYTEERRVSQGSHWNVQGWLFGGYLVVIWWLFGGYFAQVRCKPQDCVVQVFPGEDSKDS